MTIEMQMKIKQMESDIAELKAAVKTLLDRLAAKTLSLKKTG